MHHITEQLVIALVAGRVGQASDFPLTNEQNLLKIRKQLVYLAAVCLVVEEEQGGQPAGQKSCSSFSVKQKESFSDLQKQYHRFVQPFRTPQSPSNAKASTVPSTIYQWSPRICPSKEQLEIVRQDWKNTSQGLERVAKTAAKALIQQDENTHAQDQKLSSSHHHRISKQPKPKSVQRRVASTANSKTASHCNETLEDLLHHQIGGRSVDEDSDEAVDGNWIEVKRKGDKLEGTSTLPSVEQGTLESEQDTVEAGGIAASPGLTIVEGRNSPREEDLECSKQNASSPHVASTGEPVQAPADVNVTTAPDRGATFNNQPCIHSQFAELREELAQVKEKHAMELHREKQRYEDLIQSLQLRLYISETRLKTYEDALERHVQAVASNVSNAPCLPPRRHGTALTSDSQDDDTSSSLIAKVLQQKKAR